MFGGYVMLRIFVFMKQCLQCEKQFDAKRDAAKFCSVNCRVKWNRKNGKKSEIKPLQMQVLYNQILDAVNKIGQNNGLPPAAAYKIETVKTEPIKKSSWDEPQSDLVTFQELLNGMVGIQFSDEKEDYAEKIRKATHLSEKQINLLLTNLWNNK